MTNHVRFMNRALELAKQGMGKVHPNPMVGCVLVKQGRIVGEGYHPHYGGPHAEQMALKKAGSKAKGSTAYVNLEPCNHWGKTPPCAPALLQAGIKRIYISHLDPNPKVNGKGYSVLKQFRIPASVGLLKSKANQLNSRYSSWIKKKRPYVILKLALTLDGKIASKTNDSKWISSSQSRRFVHQLRSECDAVLIGPNTANVDNPTLSSHGQGKDPLRVIFDPKLQTSPNLKVFRKSNQATWLLTGASVSKKRINGMDKSGHKIIRLPIKNRSLSVINTLKFLFKSNVNKILVEGGSETAWSFLSANAVDEVWFFLAPKILGGRTAITAVGGEGFSLVKNAISFSQVFVKKIGPDLLIQGIR